MWQPEQAIAVLETLDSPPAHQLVQRWQQIPDSPHLQRATTAVLKAHLAKLSGNAALWQSKAEEHKLEYALRSEQFATYYSAWHSPNPVAAGLKTAQIRYMNIEASGGWPRIDSGPLLEQGTDDTRVISLRQRLMSTDDLAADTPLSSYFDQVLADAVQHFQRRHNLHPDSRVGEQTRLALNVPAHKRIAAIRLSRARAEELPSGARAQYVWVNIAGASTHLVRNQQTVWSGRSIVGKARTQTPELSSAIETLVLNPFWLVPDSIAKRSLLPRAARDPGFLPKFNYRAFDTDGNRLDLQHTDWRAAAQGEGPKVRLMQAPGPRNALGKVKFLFPNNYSVYLHDTPGKKSFAKNNRTLSNGCVRVEGALSLATLLLEPQGWNRARVDKALASGRPLKLALDKPLPVHTLYLTAAPGRDGSVNFFSDSYRRDTSTALAQLN